MLCFWPLDQRHETEFSVLEEKLEQLRLSADNKKKAKNTAKKERESLRKKHEEEKAKLLFSENDEIQLEKLNLIQNHQVR